MIESSSYNLTNPAFTDDIGEFYMNKTLPKAPSSMGGAGVLPEDVSLNGQLNNDVYGQPGKEKKKETSFIKKALIATAVVLGGIICIKKGKQILKWISKGFSKLISKFKK